MPSRPPTRKPDGRREAQLNSAAAQLGTSDFAPQIWRKKARQSRGRAFFSSSSSAGSAARWSFCPAGPWVLYTAFQKPPHRLGFLKYRIRTQLHGFLNEFKIAVSRKKDYMAEGPAAVNTRSSSSPPTPGILMSLSTMSIRRRSSNFSASGGSTLCALPAQTFRPWAKAHQSIRDDTGSFVNHQNTIHIILPLQCEAVPADCRRAWERRRPLGPKAVAQPSVNVDQAVVSICVSVLSKFLRTRKPQVRIRSVVIT